MLKCTAGLSLSEAAGRGRRAITARRTMQASTRLADPVGHRLHQGIHQAEDDLELKPPKKATAPIDSDALQLNRLFGRPDHADQPAQGPAAWVGTVDALLRLKRGGLDLLVYLAVT
jgi:hypothetical protein